MKGVRYCNAVFSNLIKTVCIQFCLEAKLIYEIKQYSSDDMLLRQLRAFVTENG